MLIKVEMLIIVPRLASPPTLLIFAKLQLAPLGSRHGGPFFFTWDGLLKTVMAPA
jgi:hypothetical protein